MFLSNDPIFEAHLIKSLNRTDLTVELINGSRITCASCENIDALRGRTANIVLIDEAGHVDLESVMEVIQPVVSARDGSIVMIGTPSGKAHPFYHYLQKGIINSPFFVKGYRSWVVPITDPNVVIPFKEKRIEQAKRILSPDQYAKEYLVSFESVEGRVYKEFDSVKNMSDKTFMPDRPVFIGIDLNVGFMNAIVCQIYPNPVTQLEDVHIIDEIGLSNANTEMLADEILKRYGHYLEPHQIIVYPDNSGGARKSSAGASVTDLTILKNAGFSVYHSGKNPIITDRVNNVNAKIKNAANVPSLFVHPKCKRMIQAFDSQTYDKNGAPAKGKGDINDLSGPTDAIGYLIHYRYNMNQTFSFVQ